MNSEQAKQIRIEDYLSRIGIKPIKERGQNLWYKSPFRNENEPSFKVNRDINQWHDFGSGEKGNLIDLAMKLHQTNSVSEALRAIEQAVSYPKIQQSSFSFRQQEFSEGISNVEIKPLNHPALIEMLHIRKIPIELARQYFKEVHYTLNGKPYFAVAFPNDKGGFETLNSYFKGCLPPKEITTFDKKTQTVHLFEGFMDYLSLLTLQAGQADISAVVLNSVNNLEKAVPLLSKHSKINAFLDNDEAGRQALKKLQKWNLPVMDISQRYAEYKDVNDYLCGKKLPQFQKKTTNEVEFDKPKIGKRFKR
ncbi:MULTISPECIES: toprim domain-containing protein [Proteiniphilum]|jgi:DNA primase|uniref:toprim domain-containing protein n=1 Tax=Proteiniphilum TaxID=294702 RepID=UPI000E945954|nr:MULTISPECIES: toprim domain-containing protein [Proteiniphilum]ULB34270.1 toprim domain-containing protein [Proteiniphilum propionicum]HBG79448.1 DNA primase [Porphyromonadaceae bacterium]